MYTVLVFLMIIGCGSVKRELVKTAKVEKDTLKVVHKSENIKTVNQSINDLVFLPVSAGDKKVDSLLATLFANFKTYKRSGANSYNIEYNKKAKGFEIRSKIGKTADVLIKKQDTIVKIQTKVIVKEKEVLKIRYRIPFWSWLVFIICIVGVYLLSKLKVI
ncbi:hypothetical protein THALO_30207 [Tenacibaculum halocynthiae]